MSTGAAVLITMALGFVVILTGGLSRDSAAGAPGEPAEAQASSDQR